MLFMLKALSVLEIQYLHFCCDFLVTKENGLLRKLWLNSKFMTSQTGQEIIAIPMLSNISRSKANQAMKFSQLIEYNMRNTLLEKSYTKCDGEANPRPFYKKSKLSISLDQHSEML